MGHIIIIAFLLFLYFIYSILNLAKEADKEIDD